MQTLPWITIFLLLFAAGNLLWVCTIPIQTIGQRFYRIGAYISLFLGLCAVFSTGGAALSLTVYAGACFVLSVLAAVLSPMPVRVLCAIAGAAGLGIAMVALRGSWLAVAMAVPTAVLLGGALQTMLLGHSYLNMANLSFGLLVDSSARLLVTTGARAAVSAVGTALAWSAFATWWDLDPVLVLFLVVRFLVGLIGVFGLTWMALVCAKIKSNQSATGILYVVVAFAIMGEAMACYLGVHKGAWL